jgi:hypothetical protein
MQIILDKIINYFYDKNTNLFWYKIIYISMSKTKLQSYNNDPKLKEQLVSAMIADKKAEKLVQGQFYENNKGCNIGCAEFELSQIIGEEFTNTRHQYLSENLQIPEFLLYLADTIFENLPHEESQKWAGADFWQAIPVGKDLTLLENKIKIEILINPDFGCYPYANDKTKAIIDRLVALHQQKIDGKEWDELAIESAAYSAAYSAYSAAQLAIESAAQPAARSVVYSARSAVDSAADAACSAADSAARSARSTYSEARSTYSAAYSAYFINLSKKILEILQKS